MREIIKNKTIKLLKNKKGMSTLDFIINVFILLMLFAFLMDLFVIAYRQYQVTHLTNDVIRVISKQGGVARNTPYNFPGGNENYLTKSEFEQLMKNRLEGMKITNYKISLSKKNTGSPSGEYTLHYPNYSQTDFNVDYQEYIKLEVKYEYKWSLISSFLPIPLKGEFVSTKIGYSEYKFDYNNWEGEL